MNKVKLQKGSAEGCKDSLQLARGQRRGDTSAYPFCGLAGVARWN